MPDWLAEEVLEGLAKELRREHPGAIVMIEHGPSQPAEAPEGES